MTVLTALLMQLAHTVLILLAAPLLTGAIRSLSDRLTGSRGPVLTQPWHDLRALIRKQPVHAENASPVVRAAPLLAFAAAAVCALLIPSFTLGMAFAPAADLLTVAALLGLGRVILTLAELDAGTGEGGVAAARAAALMVRGEPVLLLAVFVLSLLAGGGTLDQIVAAIADGPWPPGPAGALAVAALALLGWAEAAGPRLDSVFSARDLALVRAAGQLRLLAWCDLIGALALPAGMASAVGGPVAWGIGLAAWIARLLAFALVLATVRALGGPRRLPAVLTLAAVLCGAAAVLGCIGVAA